MRTRKAVFSLPALAVVLWVGASNFAWGQEARATLGGRVVDAQGGVIPSAAVVVTSDDTGVEQRTTTNQVGSWTVRFLIPGSYSFSVTAPGFKQAERHGITLQTADIKAIDTELELGSSTTHANWYCFAIHES